MTPSKLDLHSLIVFYHVAEEASITAAAEKLCLTQPTVTYHIRNLEKNVGLKLLDVKRQKVVLTPAGSGLFSYVAEIYRQMTGAERYIENLREASLRVGISTTFSTCAAAAASAFKKVYPHVRLVIRSSSSLDVAADVLDSNVDLGIVVGTDSNSPGLKTVTISPQQKLVLVASPSSAIAQRSRLRLFDLCGCPLIVGPETSASRRIILDKIKSVGCHMPSPILVEVDNSEWGVSLVENGEGVGLHHVSSVARGIAGGRLTELRLSGDIFVRADALFRADTPAHPMADAFISLLRDVFENQDAALTASAPAI